MNHWDVVYNTMMERKHVIASGLILVCIVAGMALYGLLSMKTGESTSIQHDERQFGKEEPYAGITEISTKHFFNTETQTHTLVGEIALPTPCDLLNWDVRIGESFPENITIDFSVVNHTESCAQVVTLQRFFISFRAHRDASLHATFEQRTIALRIIEAGPEDVPEDFDVFIKG